MLNPLTAGLVDLLILGLVSWGGVIGWRRGGFRTLIDCVSAGGAAAVVILSISYLRDALINASWALEFRIWLYERMRSIPTGSGLSNPQQDAAGDLYHAVIVGVGAVAVWIGLQMVLQVFQTVWKVPSGSVWSRIAGAGMGIGLGGILAAYMVQYVGLLSWIRGLEVLDLYLGRSFFVWIVMKRILE